MLARMTERQIAPATGKLGVLTPGMGAVASTFIAGVIAARQGLKPPIGSISQMAHIRLGTKEENRNPLIREFVPLAELDDIVFGGWDPISPNALEAARTAGVLEGDDLNAISSDLESIIPMEAVFDRRCPRQGHPQQVGPGDGADRRHRHVQVRERVRSPRDGLVRLDRGLSGADRRPRQRRRLRAGPEGR
jgi:myo-inositol-1-phosphate synthase